MKEDKLLAIAGGKRFADNFSTATAVIIIAKLSASTSFPPEIANSCPTKIYTDPKSEK